MDVLSRRELGRSSIIAIVLSGMFKGHEERVYCDGLRRQVEKVLFEERNHSMLRDFHFVTAGAYPFSEEVRNAYDSWIGSFHMGWLSGGECLDFVNPSMLRYAEYLKNEGEISSKDYDFLQGLGGKIIVAEREN